MTIHVWPTNSFVNLEHDFLSIFFINTPEKNMIERQLVKHTTVDDVLSYQPLKGTAISSNGVFGETQVLQVTLDITKAGRCLILAQFAGNKRVLLAV